MKNNKNHIPTIPLYREDGYLLGYMPANIAASRPVLVVAKIENKPCWIKESDTSYGYEKIAQVEIGFMYGGKMDLKIAIFPYSADMSFLEFIDDFEHSDFTLGYLDALKRQRIGA